MTGSFTCIHYWHFYRCEWLPTHGTTEYTCIYTCMYYTCTCTCTYSQGQYDLSLGQNCSAVAVGLQCNVLDCTVHTYTHTDRLPGTAIPRAVSRLPFGSQQTHDRLYLTDPSRARPRLSSSPSPPSTSPFFSLSLGIPHHILSFPLAGLRSRLSLSYTTVFTARSSFPHAPYETVSRQSSPRTYSRSSITNPFSLPHRKCTIQDSIMQPPAAIVACATQQRHNRKLLARPDKHQRAKVNNICAVSPRTPIDSCLQLKISDSAR